VISALIVDDERLAREGIRLRLRDEPDVRVVGEAGDGVTAVKAIAKLSPDLLFLDVRMPGLSGFEILQRISAEHLPIVIFVTAFDKYAVKAFEAHALDYLLKPVDNHRFSDALQRAREEITRAGRLDGARARLVDFLDTQARGGTAPAADERPPRPPFTERLAVRVRDRYLLLKVDDIDWIEAAANYVQICSNGRTFMLRMTLADLEQRLDGQRFVRIHRSTIVNVDRLTEVKPSLHGDFEVVLHDGTTLRMSRAYRLRLLPR
jgi:two-component system LytT family response regulator